MTSTRQGETFGGIMRRVSIVNPRLSEKMRADGMNYRWAFITEEKKLSRKGNCVHRVQRVPAIVKNVVKRTHSGTVNMCTDARNLRYSEKYW